MGKKGKWVLPLLALSCCLGFGVYRICSKQIADHTPPEISFDSEILEVSVKDSAADLLVGVTAQDAKDGDVTDSLLVEGISGLSADQLATVTYAAFDRAGNVAKARRTLRYTDYHSPRFSLSAPLLFRSGVSYDLLKYVGARDVVDGDLDDRVKATLVSGEGSVTTEGTYEVEFRVTNSMRDTVYLTVPVEVYPAGLYNAAVTLSDYLVYLKKGARFDRDAYLESLQIGVDTISLGGKPSNVSITYDSNVNTSVPGTYSVTYTVKKGIYTGCTRLIVVVEE